MFSNNNLQQIEKKGISIQQIKNQINNFIDGFPYINLIQPAVLGNGIVKLSDNKISDYINKYNSENEITTIKFVPASGAASRMFKFLYEFINSEEINDDINKFIDNIRNFSFYDELKLKLSKGNVLIDELLAQKRYSEIIKYVIDVDGLNYGNLPKALIKFHMHNEMAIVATEEHFLEAASYLKQTGEKVYLHFTISEEHRKIFDELVKSKKVIYENEFNTVFDISFSYQNEKTDTIAVDLNNEPFKLEDGSVLFRPGGHGAILENLAALNADIIFIKNIDNVCAEHYKAQVNTWKKALAGYLLEIREGVYKYLNVLDAENKNEEEIKQIMGFAEDKLMIKFPEDYNKNDLNKKAEFLFQKLNRPIRICGMVKNEGEPGGGPFWIKNKNNDVSLQIVEGSQIDMDNSEQVSILNQATHFNPVDIVCCIKDYKGNKFNLLEFVDSETGFISQKSVNGKSLKAQELPGLWNGSMANWITIFAEVPIETFNPVKTVNDLLKKGHQS